MITRRDGWIVLGFMVFLMIAAVFGPPGVTITANTHNGFAPAKVELTLSLDPERVEYAVVGFACEDEVITTSRHNATDGRRWQQTFTLYEPCEYTAGIIAFTNGYKVGAAYTTIDIR